MSDRSLSALVIATGSGVSMRSERPKPLHLLCGRPMLSYVLDAAAAVGAHQAVVVTGPSGDRVSKRILEDPPKVSLRFATQQLDRGSADAAMIGLSGFDDFEDEGDVLVLPADVPLIDPAALRHLLDVHAESDSVCTVLSTVDSANAASSSAVSSSAVSSGAVSSGPAAALAEPRIVRDRHGEVSGILRTTTAVGTSDADPVERPLGAYCIRRGLLAPAVRRTVPDRLSGRQLLEEVVAVLAETGHRVASAQVEDSHGGSALGLVPVDSRRHLAQAEAELRNRTNARWLERGVTMVDPAHTYIDVTVRLGTDVTLFPGTILQGATVVGDGCEIGPDTRLDRCEIGRESVVEKTMARLATVGDNCRVGPFAVIEPGAEISDGTVTGPFYAARTGG